MRSLMIPSQRGLWLKSTSISSAHPLPSSLLSKFDGFFVTSKLTFSDQILVPSRNSRKKFTEINEGQLGNFSCRVIENEKYSECRIPDCKSYSEMKLLDSLEDSRSSEKLTLAILNRKNPTLSNFLQGFSKPFQNHWKFMVLCGFLSLQGAQQAVAGSNIASQLQSLSFLGDLDDISTGFASVRKISL